MKSFGLTWWLTGMLAALLLGACGGGGGGGGGDDEGVQYTGKTTPATITQQNADIVVDGLMGGVPTALDLSSGGGLLKAPAAQGRPGRLSLRELCGLLADPIESALVSSGARADRRAARTETETWTEDGNCGGSVRFSLSVDDSTGDLGGRITFSSDYCDEGIRLSGGMSIDGAADIYAGEILWLNLSTDLLTVRDPDPDAPSEVSLTGTIRLEAEANVVTLSATIRDDLTDEVVKFEDFRIASDESGDYTSLTIDGRYYDAAEGYVDFSTSPEKPLVVPYDGDGPSSGEVTALGANGTRSRLTALTAETYQIDADLDGDGTYGEPGIDFTSEILYWDDL